MWPPFRSPGVGTNANASADRTIGDQNRGKRPACPEGWEAWQEEYSRREDAYHLAPYLGREERWWSLFRAFDVGGNLLAETKRLATDVRLVTDKGASAAFGETLTLEAAIEEDIAMLETAEKVWKRGKLQQLKGQIAFKGAKSGRVGIEAVRLNGVKPYRSTLTVRDARHYQAFYSAGADGELERVEITIPYFDAPTIDATGQSTGDPVLHVYRRTLTRTEVIVHLDGEHVDEESGDHGLGVVPFVNLRWQRSEDEQHGHHAAEALEPAIAAYDSAMAKADAIMRRYADPKLLLTGVKAGDSALKFGKILELPEEADAKYLEPMLQGLAVAINAAQQALELARSALPEFAIVGAGAGASGEALTQRQGDFTAKMGEIRGRWLPALADVTAYAALMDLDQKYDPDQDYLAVSAPPVFPPDVAAVLTALEATTRIQPLQPVDYVRTYKRLSLVPADVNAEDYATEAADTSADTARSFFKARAQEGTPPEEEPEE